MMLSQLLPDQEIAEDVMFSGITDDSRKVSAGDVFLAIQGIESDGKAYVDAAIDKGAVAIIADASLPQQRVPVVTLAELDTQAGAIASRFYGEPSRQMKVIGVTGTNGKTSFTHLLAQALSGQGETAGVVGTMGFGRPGSLQDAGLTTPPAVELQRRLASLLEIGCSAAVVEASSHGLVQGRLNGTEIRTAVFTNITRDHLDYHESFDAYGDAKRLLFSASGLENAVVNSDDNFARAIIAGLDEGINLVQFSTRDESVDVYARRIDFLPNGFDIEIQVPGGVIEARVPLYGAFNVENLLAVVATLVAESWEAQAIELSLGALTPVPGRMDVLAYENGPRVIIDYAHTPDALEKALGAVRLHFPGQQLTCVFGCGGDRDKGKRPMMGEIASRLADSVYVTSDNPRSEDPVQILEDVKQGCKGKHVVLEADRGKAIAGAIADTDAAGVVLIAGKGHEDYQELAAGRIDFSDREVALGVLNQQRDAVIVGLGETGLSYARYLRSQGRDFIVADDSPSDANIERLYAIAPGVEVLALNETRFSASSDVFVSPGVPLSAPSIQAALRAGAKLQGDVAMFADIAAAPVICVTGTNGKTSVVELLHHMAADQCRAYLAGNVGVPALDALQDDADLYVLEASSYQLELAGEKIFDVAVVLNLTPDHLDRYASESDYYDAKLAIYKNCRGAVVNRELGVPLPGMQDCPVMSFGEDPPASDADFGLKEIKGELCLMQGKETLLRASELSITGRHNLRNVLAALAAGCLAGLSMGAMINSVKSFQGLPHRLELIAEKNGIRFINDSKATNIGAMLSAIESEADGRNILLIAGGETKGARIEGLSEQLAPFVKSAFLIGASQAEFEAELSDVPHERVGSLAEAVGKAVEQACPGDVVLLSPGCASFDQFRDYRDRGEKFRAAVMEVLA